MTWKNKTAQVICDVVGNRYHNCQCKVGVQENIAGDHQRGESKMEESLPRTSDLSPLHMRVLLELIKLMPKLLIIPAVILLYVLPIQ